MKMFLSTTALASIFAIGTYGMAMAQTVDPSRPGSASGGIPAQAQATQGQSTQGQSTQGQSSQGQSSQGQMGKTAGATAHMSEDQIRTTMKARGYTDIEDLKRDGDTFKVGEAKRYGEDVEDLRVDASTGMVRDEKRLSEDQAKELLRDRGYSDVDDVERDGDTITAKAKRNDNEVRVRIDARSGTVTQQQASN
jgi:uncharacterized membrane protein YkoI